MPGIGSPDAARAAKAGWRDRFANELYGPLPQPPLSVSTLRQPLLDQGAERLVIELETSIGKFRTDACLWLPDTQDKPVPLICGLDFAGPIGVLSSDSFPLDPTARAYTRPDLGARGGRLTDSLRGTTSYRWPVDLMHRNGYALLISCYGSWTPDDPHLWNQQGVAAFASPQDFGAISCWAWAISRLIDVANGLPEIDTSRIAAVGHSRLGKAALWASAWDDRIRTVFANNSGCAGAAPHAHPVGETLEQLRDAYPHWLRPDVDPSSTTTDQHQLLALTCPRALYIACAEDDIWADPMGTYEALRAASTAWGHDSTDWPNVEEIWQPGLQTSPPPLGYHIRPGGHDLLPYDWRQFFEFLN